MKTKLFNTGLFGLAALSLVLTTGCDKAAPVDTSKIENTLKELKAGQDKVLKELAAVKTEVKKAPARAKPGRRPGSPDPAAVYKVPVEDAHAKGPADALVTIVEWSEFQCPFCKRVGPTMDKITETYGDKVRVAFKHNPLGFHKNAMPAAMAAEAAGKQGKFWEMHDKLFENSRDLTKENFIKWAGELKLDVNKFKKDLEDKALTEKIKKQQSQGVSLGARGTPAFFVNGRFLSGAQPFERFKTLIDEELKKAEKLVEGGTSKAKLYETIIAKGKTKP